METIILKLTTYIVSPRYLFFLHGITTRQHKIKTIIIINNLTTVGKQKLIFFANDD